MHSIEVDPPQSRLFLLSRGAAASAVLCGLLLASSDQSYATDDGEDYFAKAFETNEPITFVDTDANLRDIAWSPDGKWISFGSIESGNEDIWIRRVEGGKEVRITFDEATDVYGIWSPDGNNLLWASDRGGQTNLWSKNPFSNEAPKKITSDSDSLSSVGFAISSFSPDGNLIAFTSNKSGNDDIWIRNLRDGSTKQLTENTGRDFIPHSWSPDGLWIAFTSDRATPGMAGADIWVVNVDTKQEYQLTENVGWEWCPAWSPDGSFLLYSYSTPHTNDIHLYATARDGSKTWKILTTPFFGAVVPRWSPDGKLLSFNGGNNRAGLFNVKSATATETVIPIGDNVVDLRTSPSGELLATAVLEAMEVTLQEYNLIEMSMEPKIVSRFTAQEWVGAEMRWHPSEKSLLLRLVKPDKTHSLSLLKIEQGNLHELVAEREITLNERPWAPSGKRLAYIATDEKQLKDIFTLSLRNMKKRQVTFGGVMPRDFDWSPDEKKIIYSGYASGRVKTDLYSVPATRGKSVCLLDWENSNELNPQFSPDGAYIAFNSDRGGVDQLWLLELASGDVRVVDKGNVGVFSKPIWTNDSQGIFFTNQGQGHIYKYELNQEKSRLFYNGQTWGRPIDWNTTTGLILRGRKEGGDIWLMRAPTLEPQI